MPMLPETGDGCERLASWLSEPESASGAQVRRTAAGLAAELPRELDEHVRECLACYRLAAEWRDLGRDEAALRELLGGAAVADGLPSLDDGDDAFWKDLPGRVYTEVMGPQAARMDVVPPSRATTVPPRKAVGRRWWPAAAASLSVAAAIVLFRAAPLRQSSLSPEPPAVRADATSEEAPPETEESEPAADEPGWVGALADLSPHEMTRLLAEADDLAGDLGDDDSGLAVFPSSSSGWQELDETWDSRPVSFEGAFSRSRDESSRSAREGTRKP